MLLPISSFCNWVDYFSISYLCQTEYDLIHIDMWLNGQISEVYRGLSCGLVGRLDLYSIPPSKLSGSAIFNMPKSNLIGGWIRVVRLAKRHEYELCAKHISFKGYISSYQLFIDAIFAALVSIWKRIAVTVKSSSSIVYYTQKIKVLCQSIPDSVI